MDNKRGQITIFIIIAILIVAIVAGYFALKKTSFKERIPSDIQPVENTLLTCLQEDLEEGVSILESQGGYIYLPEFERGSDYMPFSSQLNFLGNPIPYWYYVSGNNIEKEQVPTIEKMQGDLARFVDEKIVDCDLSSYSSQGYDITRTAPSTKVKISDGKVEAALSLGLGIVFNGQSFSVTKHNKVINSHLGKLYSSSLKVYDEEQKKYFLEKYGLDILRLYAPVDGVEIGCSPLHWNADDVFQNISEAIEVNTLKLSSSGKSNDYFRVDLPVSEDVSFLTSKNWPKTYEVLPSQENLLLASPMGNQPGLGILGFCYVPYHFVYDLKYPVLVQVSKGKETFQFPLAVVIRGNKERYPVNTSAYDVKTIGLCENKNVPLHVSVFDSNSKPVEARISYECFGESCTIGEGSSINENFPQCVNGFVVADAPGFKESRTLFSTTNGGSLTLYLNKEYELPVDLKLGGSDYEGEAMINFVSDENTFSIFYPEQKTIKLSEGVYDIDVSVYKESTLELGSITKEQCVDIPIGIFDLKKKKCFDIEIPSQEISRALSGGGKSEEYLTESDLESANSIEINVPKFPEPNSLDSLQNNYALFEISKSEVSLK